LRRQLVAQCIGQRPGRRLACCIRRQFAAIDPRRNRQPIQQGAAAVGPKHRRKRLAHVRHAKEVGLENLARDSAMPLVRSTAVARILIPSDALLY
jgi:hypothetical protein